MTITKSLFTQFTRAFALSLCTALLLNFVSCSDSSTSQDPKVVHSTYTATKDIFSSLIASLTENSTIEVTGELSDSDLTTIANAIKNSTYKVNLDLSQTTGLTSIPINSFRNCLKLSGITIPDSVTSIREEAFKGCTSLSSVTIPDSVTYIFNNAFYSCNSLSSVTIPDSVTSIGGYAFYGCTFLSSVTIPDSVTSIGKASFSGCSSLSSVTMPESVTSIGWYAFSGCSKLTSISFIDTTTWYRTASETNWNNKINGTLTDVSDPATNATYFTDTYDDYYWYKLDE